MAAASALQWAIARSKLPSHLKATLQVLALMADPLQGFANIKFSKESIGELTGKGERAAREDMADLVLTGVLTIAEHGGGSGRATRYQLWFDRLGTWTDLDTAELKRIRAERRGKGAPGQKTRIPGSGFSKLGHTKNPDPRIRGTRIPGSGEGTY